MFEKTESDADYQKSVRETTTQEIARRMTSEDVEYVMACSTLSKTSDGKEVRQWDHIGNIDKSYHYIMVTLAKNPDASDSGQVNFHASKVTSAQDLLIMLNALVASIQNDFFFPNLMTELDNASQMREKLTEIITLVNRASSDPVTANNFLPLMQDVFGGLKPQAMDILRNRHRQHLQKKIEAEKSASNFKLLNVSDLVGSDGRPLGRN